jgi:hypothetical protein
MELQDHKVTWVFKVSKVLKVFEVYKARKGFKVHKVTRDHKAYQAMMRLDYKVIPDVLVRRVIKVIKVIPESRREGIKWR